jgi:sugar lactone lactonase YvrE
MKEKSRSRFISLNTVLLLIVLLHPFLHWQCSSRLVFVNGQQTARYLQVVAGTNINGYSGDNQQATSSQLNFAAGSITSPGIFGNSNGILFIGDFGNRRVRKIDSTGIITTVAGTGSAGTAGSSGPGTSTDLGAPSFITGDTAGSFMYFTDNKFIWKYQLSNGNLSRYAGNIAYISGFAGDGQQAITARFNNPHGVFLSTMGLLYIADSNNHRVRVIATDGIITTFAGIGGGAYGGDSGMATNCNLNIPYGVYSDTTGNVFIADKGNSRIRKVDTANIITTFAGGGVNGDGGRATSASLSDFVYDVKGDSFGNIYFTDNCKIRMVSINGIIDTIIGTGSCGIVMTYSLASSSTIQTALTLWIDTKLSIYFAEPQGLVQKANWQDFPSSQEQGIRYLQVVVGTGTNGYTGDNQPATSVDINFDTFGGIFGNSNGLLFVGDYDNYRLRKVDSVKMITTIVGSGTQGVLGNGGVGTSVNVNMPSFITGDTAGLFLYFSDSFYVWKYQLSNGTLFRYAGAGTSGYFGDGQQATAALFRIPRGVWLSTMGLLYVSDSSNNLVRVIAANGIIDIFAGSGPSGGVGFYDGDGGLAKSTTCKLYNPYGVYSDTVGNVFIADKGNNRIRKVDSSGIIRTFAGGGGGGSGNGGQATSAVLSSLVYDIKGDQFGNIYFPDDCIIRMVNVLGIISTIIGTGTCANTPTFGFSLASATNIQIPFTLWVDSNRNIYFAEKSGLVRKAALVYTPSSQPSSLPSSQPSSQPTRVPSSHPSSQPTRVPSSHPSSQPTRVPSSQPSSQPSQSPFSLPSSSPSSQPSFQPTKLITFASLKDGLLAYYPFDGNALDKSGNGNNGEIFGGVTLTTNSFGLAGKALKFDGTSGYIKIANGDVLNFVSNFTISYWCKMDALLGESSSFTILDKSSLRNLFRIFHRFDSASVQFSSGVFSGTHFDQSTWFHVVFTKHDTKLSCYINGMNQWNFPSAPKNLGLNSTLPLIIGGYNQQYTRSANVIYDFYKGCLDEIWIFNRSLSSLEISLLHNFASPTSRPSSVPSSQPSRQPSSIPTHFPSCPPSSIPSAQPLGRPTNLPSVQPSSSPSSQPNSVPSAKPTCAPTLCPSSQPSNNPTFVPTGSPSNVPSIQPSSTPSGQPSLVPSANPTSLPTVCPSSQPSNNPTFVPTGSPSNVPSTEPSTSPSDIPSSVPSAPPSGFPTGIPSYQPSSVPTLFPSCQPSSIPSIQPSSSPSVQPSSVPSVQPSSVPTFIPTCQPSSIPSVQPFSTPSSQPSSIPTAQPSGVPTFIPTCQPKGFPSSYPTLLPSGQPSSFPSLIPTGGPSVCPISVPSLRPALRPSSLPSQLPAVQPSSLPTLAPSCFPSACPSAKPSSIPSSVPSLRPTYSPISLPSGCPSVCPSLLPTTVPSSMPTVDRFSFPKLSVISRTSFRTSLDIGLSLSHDGIVFGGVFALNEIPTDISLVLIQSNLAVSKEKKVFLSFINLQPASDYIIYFVSRSLSGISIMDTEEMLLTGLLVSTLCCRELIISPQSDILAENQNMFKFLILNSGFMSTSSLVITFHLFHEVDQGNDVAGSTLVPSYLNISSNNFLSNYVSLRGLQTGNYSLSASLQGMDTFKFKVMFVLPGTEVSGEFFNFTVIPQDIPLPPPSLVNAIFSNDGSYLTVSFDSFVYAKSLSSLSAFSCDDLFTFSCSARSKCQWKRDDFRIVYVYLMASDECAMMGDLIEVRNDISLRTVCASVGGCVNYESWMTLNTSSSASRTTILPPDNPIKPTVIISTPSQLPWNCSDLLLDITSSTGNNGRAWSNISISVSSSSENLDLSTLQLFLNNHRYRLSPPLKVSANLFPVPNVLYLFRVRLCNFFDQCSEAIQSTNITTNRFPAVRIISGGGSSNRITIRRSQPLLLTSSLLVGTSLLSPECHQDFEDSFIIGL